MSTTGTLQDLDALRLLGRGQYDAGLFVELQQAVDRRTVLALELVRRRTVGSGNGGGLVGDLLGRWFAVARTDPCTFGGLLRDPFVAIWARAVLSGEGTIDASGAVARLLAPGLAGPELQVSLPLDSDGVLRLARCGGEVRAAGAGTAEVALGADGLVVRFGSGTVRFASTGEIGTIGDLGWFPDVRLTASADVAGALLHLDVALVTRDPAAERIGHVEGEHLDPAAVAAWRRTVDRAWTLLGDRHPTYLPGLADICTVLVPQMQRDPSRHVSSTHADGYGAIGLSRTDDLPTFAVALVHEAQHLKLSALLETVQMHNADATPRYYAGWRPDPRPYQALLHGVYAFSAVTEFWRREHEAATDSVLRRRSALEFSLWAAQTSGSLRALVEADQATDAGRAFMAGIEDVVAGWSTDEVEPEVRQAVADIIAEHRFNWTLGARAGASSAPIVRTGLQDAWRRRLLGGPGGATDDPVNVALVAGDHATPVAWAAVLADPADVTAWFRLSLALARTGAEQAVHLEELLLAAADLDLDDRACALAAVATTWTPGSGTVPALPRSLVHG